METNEWDFGYIDSIVQSLLNGTMIEEVHLGINIIAVNQVKLKKGEKESVYLQSYSLCS